MKKDLPMREKKVDYWNGKTTEVDWKSSQRSMALFMALKRWSFI